MTFYMRNCSKLLHRNGNCVSQPMMVTVRGMSNNQPGKPNHAIWRRYFFGVSVPLIIISHVYTFGIMEPAKRPEFVPYEHLRIINRPFPWGDGKHPFIFNP